MSGPVLGPLAAPQDWRSLLANPRTQWRAGYSAMATARCWSSGFPPEVAALLGENAELQIAVAEHKVPMPGRGLPSQCDVFALVRADEVDMAVAVEAKVDEPFGPTVTDWLGDRPSENKRVRLGAICAWLGRSDPPGTLRYQLFHRTAAAVLEARRFRRPVAAMIVHSFSPARRWLGDFAEFTGWLGLSAGPDMAVETVLPEGFRLRLGWACGAAHWLDPA